MSDFKRYYMRASNGSVVAHESKDGEWCRIEEILRDIKSISRSILGDAKYDELVERYKPSTK